MDYKVLKDKCYQGKWYIQGEIVSSNKELPSEFFCPITPQKDKSLNTGLEKPVQSKKIGGVKSPPSLTRSRK